MATFLASIVVMVLVVAGMAIGVIMGRAPIKGSCGGMGAVGIDSSCELCGGDPMRCDEESASASSAVKAAKPQFYDADK